ncbi:hypothetical protein GW17_00004512 [Ensete ventricosum]|nr:hypothetical protein GW17_00004512 [Ensete ventricosum]
MGGTPNLGFNKIVFVSFYLLRLDSFEELGAEIRRRSCSANDLYLNHPMQVAILDGITMGGGAGVSVPGTFRIATDKTV